jgi:hypothetical protein
MADIAETVSSYGPRLFELSDNDHRGVVVTMGSLFIVYSFMVLAMRLLTRYRSMGVDDYLAIAATVRTDLLPLTQI